MKKNILILFLAICMMIASGLPYFGKELFVDNTGHIDHMDLFTVFLLLAGLRFNWKYIKEIIIGLFSFYLVWIVLIGINLLINNPELLKPGYYLLSFDLMLIIILTIMLKRFERTTVANII